MAQTTIGRVRKYFTNFNWQESYASLILGAIIVIILGLLVANYFTRRGQQEIGTGGQTSQPQETQTPGEYKIRAGDSLSAIAEKVYGSQDFWPVLATTNKIVSPNLIFVDWAIKLPSKEEAKTVKAQLAVTNWEIKEGDTLFTIADKVYGDGSKWVLLDRANNVGRLSNGNPLIFAGTTLTVPR